MSTSYEEFQRARGLKVLHLNIRSLLMHYEEVCTTLLDGTVDVLVLGETWLNNNVSSSLLYVDGYHLLRYDRKTLTKTGTRKARGGLCIYVKDKFDIKIHTTLFSSTEDLELMACTLCPQNQKKIKIIGLYRPPSCKLDVALDCLSN